MNKCIGCGELTNQELCERCFRIKNYNDYKLVDKTNDDYIPILENISKTNSLVVLVVDLFNISKNLELISNYLNNKVLLVLTKRDILPLSVYDKNINEYFNNYNLNVIDKVIISSKNNYNFDLLYSKINKYKTDDVYVI
jgi:ribosome biogenesis GTPase A